MNDLLPAKDKFIQAAADLSGRDPGSAERGEGHCVPVYGEPEREGNL